MLKFVYDVSFIDNLLSLYGERYIALKVLAKLAERLFLTPEGQQLKFVILRESIFILIALKTKQKRSRVLVTLF